MRNEGITGAAVAPSNTAPDLPMRETVEDVAAWRAEQEEKGRRRALSPIAAAREARAAAEAAAAAAAPAAAETAVPAAVEPPAPEPVAVVESAPVQAAPKPKPTPPPRPATSVGVSDAVLAQAYLEGDTVDQLATRHDLTAGVVRRRLTKVGVRLRDERFREVDVDAIAKAYQDGATVAEVAAAHSCDVRTVRRALKDADVTLRPRPQRARPDDLTAEIVRLYRDELLPATEVGKRVGRSGRTILAALHAAGVEVRPPGRAKPTPVPPAPEPIDFRKALAAAGITARELREWAAANGHALTPAPDPSDLLALYLEATSTPETEIPDPPQEAPVSTPQPAPVADVEHLGDVVPLTPPTPLPEYLVPARIPAASAFGPIASGLVTPTSASVSLTSEPVSFATDPAVLPPALPREPVGVSIDDAAVDMDAFDLLERLVRVGKDLAALGQPYAARAVARRAAALAARTFRDPS